MKCATCVYFATNPDHGDGGICQRHPPTPFPFARPNPITGEARMEMLSVFPQVLKTWKCGEYLPDHEKMD